jgi:hypothetical protein
MNIFSAMGAAGGVVVGFLGIAHASVLTINLDRYSSAVYATPGLKLATMTVTDLSGSGVQVEFALNPPAGDVGYFAATGGQQHATLAFNLDKTIAESAITFVSSTPSLSDFSFSSPYSAGSTYGSFAVALDGLWNGTSTQYAGPITFDISGLTTQDFAPNSNGYWAIVDAGFGTPGAVSTGVIASAVPETSTWAMMLLGFAGLGFAGYRRKQKGSARWRERGVLHG